MDPRRALDVRLYGALLYLCPPAFRQTFRDDMIQDFADSRAEAAAPGDRLQLYLHTAADLARTIVIQWWRTGWPVIMAAAGAIAASLAAGVAAVWPRQPFPVAPATPDNDAILFVLLAVVVLFVIASTILITLWTSQFVRRRRV